MYLVTWNSAQNVYCWEKTIINNFYYMIPAIPIFTWEQKITYKYFGLLNKLYAKHLEQCTVNTI